MRFAVLAADTAAKRLALQALSVVFEESKLHQQPYIAMAATFGVNTFENAVEYMGNEALHAGAVYHPAFHVTSGLDVGLGAVSLSYIIFKMVPKLYQRYYSLNGTQYPLYYAHMDCVYWLAVVAQQFPRLAGVGLGRQT